MRKLPNRISVVLLFAVLLGSCGYKQQLKTGKENFNNLRYSDAADKFKKSLEKKPENYEAVKMLALTYQKMHKYEEANKMYQLAMNYPQVIIEDKFNYAKMLMSQDKHEEAELLLREYLAARPGDKVAKNLLESCQFIELFKEDTSRYSIKALPLMSNLSMYSPVQYDGGLAYTAERSEQRKENPWTGNSYNDMFFMKDSGDTWNDQKSLGKVLNGPYNDGPISFDKKEEFTVFTRSYSINGGKRRKKNDQNYNNLFLYSSTKTGDEWGEVKELSFNSKDYSNVHPTLNADGDTLYFASDRSGGQGGYDIYMSVRDKNDKWSKPKNLGPEVNTAANDVFPVLHSDGSLHFSSDGHPSLGGLDIFRTERIGDTWRKPRNINYPVNSTNDDFGMINTDVDSVFYFTSNRGGVDRIYRVVSRNRGDVMIDGIVLGPDSMPFGGATVRLIDNRTGEVVEELVTGPDGKFNFNLKPDMLYKIESSKPGYLTESYERSTVGQEEDVTEELVLRMRELVVTDTGDPNNGGDTGSGSGNETTYEVPNIYYDLDQSYIRADAAAELNKVVTLLNDNPGISIQLRSHTDAQHDDAYNMSLSQRRADSAKAYLVRKGIKASRISTKGFGETRIVNRCKNGVPCSDREHEENRRTEFIITGVSN